MKFSPGDRVIIKSRSASNHGRIGTVQGYQRNNGFEAVAVLIDNPISDFNPCYFKDSSLELIENRKEITTMNNDMIVNIIPGNYEVALCTFPKSANPEKQYAYALFNRCATIGDHALVQSTNNYGVVRIEDIRTMNEHEAAGGYPITNEIICKVDFSAIDQRKEQRKRKEELRKQMDKLVKENQELILYQALAEKSPEMAELLNEYKSL